jgi:hypothetical protein
MPSTDSYEKAHKRVQAKKKFYKHLGTYLVMSTFFYILNMLTSPGAWWFYWPMLGWGIGIAMQYVNVFGFPGSGLGSPDWEERELEKEIRRLSPKEKRKDSDMDDYLELREVEAKKEPQANYREDDLV